MGRLPMLGALSQAVSAAPWTGGSPYRVDAFAAASSWVQLAAGLLRFFCTSDRNCFSVPLHQTLGRKHEIARIANVKNSDILCFGSGI